MKPPRNGRYLAKIVRFWVLPMDGQALIIKLYSNGTTSAEVQPTSWRKT